MTVEASQITVKDFLKVGAILTNSLILEFISISKETNREPDIYHLLLVKTH